MEFKTLALLVLSVVVLIILIMLAISISQDLGSQVNNATGFLRF